MGGSVVGIFGRGGRRVVVGRRVGPRKGDRTPVSGVGAIVEPGRKVTFVELGSVGCRQCEAMKPVRATVRARFGDRVAVVFLLPDGTEFSRHEGYLSEKEVVAILHEMETP